jgi:hypothetical protein
MVLSLDEEKVYDTSPIYIEKAFEKLPWKSRFYYEEATDFKEYNYKHCPFYSENNNESKSFLKIRISQHINSIKKICSSCIPHYKEI